MNNGEYNDPSQHVRFCYMADCNSPSTPGQVYGATPKEAAANFFAKYPRCRTPINVHLVHEYKNGNETMVRFWDSWKSWRKIAKKDYEAILPWVAPPFDAAFMEKTFSTTGVCLFHLPKV